jgi:hypothetical protein
MPEYLTDIRLLYADVGPVRPIDFTWNRCRLRLEAIAATAGGPTIAGNLPAREAERVLRQVEWNFIALTRTVPMA